MNREQLASLCEEYAEQLVALRRDFHRYPESGWTEFRTTAVIAKTLEQAGFHLLMGTDAVNTDALLGYPAPERIAFAMQRALLEGADAAYIERTKGYTGLCAVLDTGRPGPTTAFRFDIDSNEVTEQAEEGHRPFDEGFGSLHPGEAHACGHDGHTAIGIILGLLLARIKQSLCGSFKLIFQPAEEGVRGGKAMAASGILEDVDYLLSGHIGFGAKQSDLLITGVMGFLATTKLDARLTGKAAHAGAAPEEGNNALLAAASATLNIHALCQDGRGASRVNVGMLEAGTGRNVIPANALLKVETRGETTAINERVVENTHKALRASSELYGCSLETTVVGGANSGESSPALSKLVGEVAKEFFPALRVQNGFKLGGSEDVTFLMEAVQARGGEASYSMFGTELAAGHHAFDFDFQEDVLLRCAKIYAGCALRLNGIDNA